MSSTLMNVRLDEDRVRKVRRLRARGISISEVVRAAIDERHDALEHSARDIDAAAVVRRILERYPDPPGEPTRTRPNIHDRHVARREILKAMKRKGR